MWSCRIRIPNHRDVGSGQPCRTWLRALCFSWSEASDTTPKSFTLNHKGNVCSLQQPDYSNDCKATQASHICTGLQPGDPTVSANLARAKAAPRLPAQEPQLTIATMSSSSWPLEGLSGPRHLMGQSLGWAAGPQTPGQSSSCRGPFWISTH